MDITTQFINECCYYNELNLPRIKKCLDLLSENEIWVTPNNNTNSVANLILHLNGNITQYILSGLGGVKDNRQREKEFTTRSGYSKIELYTLIETTILEAGKVIRSLPEDILLKTRFIQGFNITGTGAIIHVTEHLSYHTGQIAFITKSIKDKDLGFYSNSDLNTRNS